MVIVTYNSERYLADCIRSIREFQPLAQDCARGKLRQSTSVRSLIREWQLESRIIVIYRDPNVGYARGANLGPPRCLVLSDTFSF